MERNAVERHPAVIAVTNIVYQDNRGLGAAGRSGARLLRRGEFSGFGGHKLFYRAVMLSIIKANSKGR